MRLAWVILLFALVSTRSAAADPTLAELPRSGQQLFVQSCGICHLKPTLTSERYGPALSKETVEGREEAVRELIRTGTARMPGFQYGLAPAQIDAIIAYLKTVPTPPAAAQPARRDANPNPRN
jgi:mono/diheme cytochrome c family protein